MELFLPWVVGLGVAFSVGILALRTAGVDPRLAAIPAAAVALLGAVTALVRARPKFLSADEALVRLDADLGLRNRLTSAREGVGEWPAPREDAVLALRWKWPVLLRPPAAALALGIVDTAGKYLIPNFGEFFFYAALILILFRWPHGFFHGRAA